MCIFLNSQKFIWVRKQSAKSHPKALNWLSYTPFKINNEHADRFLTTAILSKTELP